MKTVFVVIGWYTGEEAFISSIFENEVAANNWATTSELEDEYGYQYYVQAWEVK